MRLRRGAAQQGSAVGGFAFRQGLDWGKLADGHVHRLKRGKHYRGDIQDVMLDLAPAAEAMGKYAHIVKDPLGHQYYLWVQFVDGQIALGERCPAGHGSLTRFHLSFVRCDECGRLLHLKGELTDHEPEDDDEDDDEEELEQDGQPEPLSTRRIPRKYAERLEHFSDLHLEPYGRSTKLEAYRGYGTNSKGRQLILVLYYLDAAGKRRPDPWRPAEQHYRIESIPAEPFAEFVDFENLAPPPP